MSKTIIYLFLIVSSCVIAQNKQLADSFFEDGSYQKAIIEYDKLIKKQPYRLDFLLKKVTCLQELNQFKKAEITLQKFINGKYKRPQLLVELGYNAALQKDSINADKNYQKAIDAVLKQPNTASRIGATFEKYNLLQEAKKCYTTATKINPKLNYHFQLARIYGQLNKIDLMFNSYLNQMLKNQKLIPRIQQFIGEFITDDAENENNILLKRTLLKKLQNNPNTLWNKQLSWLFIQQKQYKKAFVQEKAIYKRDAATLDRLFNLAQTAKEDKKYEIATTVFNFLKTKNLSIHTEIEITDLLLKMEQESVVKKDYPQLIKKYEIALDSFGINNNTLKLQLNYIDALVFKTHQITTALTFLKKNKKQKLSRFNKVRYLMKYADVLVANSQFNKALLNYSKIQKKLKNNVLSQEARYKVAKTSYYKGDFDWALQQLKVLKTSTSQLIANDALNLHLLINDHIKEDSLHIALQKYAKADLLAFQNKKEESIVLLSTLLTQHKGDKIEDDTLFLQGKLYVEQGKYKKAIQNYKTILQLEKSIFTDDALYSLAQIYLKLANYNQAKHYFETIIFNHPDSIYFVNAQKNYRKLRGDHT